MVKYSVVKQGKTSAKCIKGYVYLRTTNNNNMKKMTEYIIAGVKADDENVFMKRVGELLEKKELLELLTNGVPVGVRLTDAEELLKYVKEDRKNKIILEVTDVSLNEDFAIVVKYKYISSVYYFRNEDDREYWIKNGYYCSCDKSEKPTEEFTVRGERISTDSTSYPINPEIPGVEIWTV